MLGTIPHINRQLRLQHVQAAAAACVAAGCLCCRALCQLMLASLPACLPADPPCPLIAHFSACRTAVRTLAMPRSAPAEPLPTSGTQPRWVGSRLVGGCLLPACLLTCPPARLLACLLAHRRPPPPHLHHPPAYPPPPAYLLAPCPLLSLQDNFEGAKEKANELGSDIQVGGRVGRWVGCWKGGVGWATAVWHQHPGWLAGPSGIRLAC